MRVGAGVCVVAGLAMIGCSFDTDALFGSSPSDSGPADAMSEPPLSLPWLPRVPDSERIEACEACAKASEDCSLLRDECAEHEACREALTCEGTRGSDPSSIVECQSDAFVRELACQSECDESDLFCESECREYEFRLTRYRDCVFQSACGDECGRGRNFECDDRYAWDAAPPTQTEATIELELLRFRREGFPTNGYPGVRVDTCGGSSCGAPPLSEGTGENGLARFRLQLRDGWGGTRIYLSSDDPLWALREVHYPLSLERSRRIQIVTTTEDERTFGLARFAGVTTDPDKIDVGVRTLDCTLTPVNGATLSMEGADPDVVPVYMRNYIPNAAATTTDQTGLAFLTNVTPDEPVTVTASVDGVIRATSLAFTPDPGLYASVYALPSRSGGE